MIHKHGSWEPQIQVALSDDVFGHLKGLCCEAWSAITSTVGDGVGALVSQGCPCTQRDHHEMACSKACLTSTSAIPSSAWRLPQFRAFLYSGGCSNAGKSAPQPKNRRGGLLCYLLTQLLEKCQGKVGQPNGQSGSLADFGLITANETS